MRSVRRSALAAPDQKAAAQARLDQICTGLAAGLDSLEAAHEAYAQAVIDQDWKTLGFHSSEAWRLEIMGRDKRFQTTARKQIGAILTAAGKTTREIAVATGASQSTVIRDQAEIPESPDSEPGVLEPNGSRSQPETLNNDQRAARGRAVPAGQACRSSSRAGRPGPRPRDPGDGIRR